METSVTVENVNLFNGNSKTKAFVDINYHGLILKGFRVVEGNKGPFVAPPQTKAKNGEYYPDVVPAKGNGHIFQHITGVTMEAYNAEITKAKTAA